MKVNEFESCGAGCGIYLIRNLVNQHIYVGQTSRKFNSRWKEYITIAKNLSAKKNVTSIILAIRKYGIENFDFSILEQCPKDQLDSREQFWIKAFKADSHDNYNQTAGGQNAALKSSKPMWFNELVSDLQNTRETSSILAKKYNISDSLVCDINYGRRYYTPEFKYPLRTKTNVLKKAIIDDLINSSLTFEELALKYNVSFSMIKRLNNGYDNYKFDNYHYPLRAQKTADLELIVKLLQTTNLTYKEIALKSNVSQDTVYKINKGIRDYNKNLSYPIRK